MRVLVTTWFAVAVLDDGRVVERRDFPREAHAIAERLRTIRRGGVLDEERALAGRGVAVVDERLRPLGTLRPRGTPVALDLGGADPKLLREAALLVARDEFREASSERDRFVVQSVRALDEVHKTANTLMERLRDWYALHFPEALRDPGDPAKFARALADAPDRPAVATRLNLKAPEDSIGAPLGTDELGAIQDFAKSLVALFGERDRLQALIEAEARKAAPTLAGLVGPLIAARLVSQANGLERLAYFPASTVQTLGAENALFLHLKESKSPPKHGILFQHPLINTAPRFLRGRYARVLAAHAVLAARLDVFGEGTSDRSGELRPSLEAQVARLKKLKPPQRGGRGPARGTGFRPRAPTGRAR